MRNFNSPKIDIVNTHSYLSIADKPVPPPDLTIDGILPSIVLLITVATGAITIMTTLTKGQEEKINRLMSKIDELDTRLDINHTILAGLSDKYATKQEFVSLDHRLEAHFHRLNDKFDRVIISVSKPNP